MRFMRRKLLWIVVPLCLAVVGATFLASKGSKPRFETVGRLGGNISEVITQDIWDSSLPSPIGLPFATVDFDHPASKVVASLESELKEDGWTIKRRPDGGALFTHPSGERVSVSQMDSATSVMLMPYSPTWIESLKAKLGL